MSNSLRRVISLLLLLPIVCIISCSTYDPQNDVFRGAEANRRIARGRPLPKSARDFYIFDGGTCMGTITYWSFKCDTIDDCWHAIENLGGPAKSKFVEWQPSKRAVVMEGPAFYWPQLATNEWDVGNITNGFVCERSRGDDWMDFYALDADRLIVYFHEESGGFPTDEYNPHQVSRK